MADNSATQRRSADNLVVGGPGDAYSVKNLAATVELAASSAGTTVTFGRIPSNARILGSTRLYNDDLASTGSPTLDLGLINVDSNITDDPDAIGNGFALSSAGSDVVAISDVANIGLPAWDFVNAQTSDPGGEFIVRGVVADAATTATGTITLDMYYVVD
jgi:hypothetical protein